MTTGKIASLKVDGAENLEAPTLEATQRFVDAVDELVGSCTPKDEKPIELDVQIITVVGSRAAFASIPQRFGELEHVKNGTAVLIIPTEVLAEICLEFVVGGMLTDIVKCIKVEESGDDDVKGH